jgi:protein-disulfide isomerase
VKTMRRSVLAMIVLAALAPCLRAQDGTEPATNVQRDVEKYLRHLYAFGPDVKLIVSPLKETGIPGLFETTVDVTIDQNHQSATMYVSKDGKYLLRGELDDLTKDPLAETRAKLQIKDAPSIGKPDAPVTIVEFADFECPVCRQLHEVMRDILPKYPQIRFIFKDFPIGQIHPWARTGALAGRCAYQQNPKAFWKIYDLLYDNQDLISADNAWEKMVDYAAQAGLKTDSFKACMASPEAAAAVDASVANGKLLEVNSTPTLFIDGRRVVGADGHLIEQYIQYDLPQEKSAKK